MLLALASPIHKAVNHLDNIPIFSYETSPFKEVLWGNVLNEHVLIDKVSFSRLIIPK
jgi:hypothetical protein